MKPRHAIGGHPVPLDGETSEEDSSSDEERSGVQSPFNFTSRDTFDQADNVSYFLLQSVILSRPSKFRVVIR